MHIAIPAGRLNTVPFIRKPKQNSTRFFWRCRPFLTGTFGAWLQDVLEIRCPVTVPQP